MMQSQNDLRGEQLARRAVGGTAAVLLAIVWTHALAGVLRAFTPEAALMARSLTLGAVLLAVAGVASRSPLVAFGTGLVSVVALHLIFPGSLLVSLALLVAPAAAVAIGLRLARRLPGQPGRWVRRKPILVAAWAFLAVVSVVQVGRLSTYMTDPDFDWFGTTRHAFWAKHECLPAYVYGAELAERGETNPWDAAHYPGLNPQAEPSTRITGLPVEDPFQYTPQFLMLPALAIQLTDHYPSLRLGWYGLQTTLFLGVAWWLAMWVAGRENRPLGMVAAYFLPLTLVAIPTLHSLQYGQFHLAALALAVAGMLLLETIPGSDRNGARRALGGAALAAAILAKIFPVVLLIPLAVQRRWRDLTSIAAWGVGATALSLVVFGPVVFGNFFTYHLPRLGSGEAFAFGVAWPEVRELLIVANHGAYGLVTKLGELGVPGMSEAAASLVGKVYLLSVLVLAGLAGIRLSRAARASRAQRAVAWISLLGLASMASAGAFADYVPVAFAWLLPFLLHDLSRRDIFRSGGSRAALATFYGVVAFFQFTLLGAAPWGDWAPTEWTLPLSAVGVVLLFAGFGVALRAALRPAAAADTDAAHLDQPTQEFDTTRWSSSCA